MASESLCQGSPDPCAVRRPGRDSPTRSPVRLQLPFWNWQSNRGALCNLTGPARTYSVVTFLGVMAVSLLWVNSLAEIAASRWWEPSPTQNQHR